uniref:ATP synthase F0 subunit 8 n=1 Tax=Eisenia andrei TaxID=168636 RepID=UPI002113C8CD|nr:ATP synthase F0 subunit 8 [Eisenia andrei]UTB53917.1 ATP synthase F0 subunit 8 [Eisenia andrei]
MPHLSPMSWIISIIMFWTAISMLTSTLWWSNNHLFSSETKHNAHSLETSWSWS